MDNYQLSTINSLEFEEIKNEAGCNSFSLFSGLKNHRAHRGHREKQQLPVVFASSVYQNIDAFLPQAMAKLPSEYEMTRALPDNLRSSLPSIEELEAELGGMHKEESCDE